MKISLIYPVLIVALLGYSLIMPLIDKMGGEVGHVTIALLVFLSGIIGYCLHILKQKIQFSRPRNGFLKMVRSLLL